MDYESFIHSKSQLGGNFGFEPLWMPDCAFDFQRSLIHWACSKGRAAVFADCGLGKTLIQLSCAENIVRKTNGKVLVLTPLAVAFQTVDEGQKIGVEVKHRREGVKSGDKIVVANYERLHYFSPDDFECVICDESSILKNFDGETRKNVTDFMKKRPFRFLFTATAAPNDYIELGTSSEAVGDLGAQDMLNKFFKKAQQTTSARQEHMSGIYQMRPHAQKDFWRWVCSWARALRKPSDLGFDDGAFRLPELTVRSHCVKASKPIDGYLFDIPALGLAEQRADLRRTIGERCDMAAQLVNSHNEPAVAWCNLNEEGDRLTKAIRGAEQVSGNDSEERKEEVFSAFVKGEVRALVTKPVIGGFGLNFQHCAHQTYFPSHSYEQYYQSVRRSWRFGQTRPVVVDMITTDGQENVLANLNRKAEQAAAMFDKLVQMMWHGMKLDRDNKYTQKERVPSWL